MCRSTDSNFIQKNKPPPAAGGGTTRGISSTLLYDIFGSDSDSDLEEGGRRGSSGRGSGRGPVIDLTADFEHLFTTADAANDGDDDDDADHDDDDGSIDLSCYMDSQYVGLKQLAYMIGICAHRLSESNRVSIAEKLYIDALSIDPYHEFIGNMAIMYESHFKNLELAKKYYLMAIENEDEIAMYNLADMYGNQQNTALMVQYFEMAAQHGDSASRKRLITHYHKEADMPNFSKHYYAHLTLEDSAFDCLDDEDDFATFQQSNSTLAIAAQVDCVTKNAPGAASMDANIVRLRDYLHTLPEYCAFKNKVTLFTRLNHVVECGICYDEDKVNIDIHCGHTVCVDCYTMLYNKACPFCRQEPLTA